MSLALELEGVEKVFIYHLKGDTMCFLGCKFHSPRSSGYGGRLGAKVEKPKPQAAQLMVFS